VPEVPAAGSGETSQLPLDRRGLAARRRTGKTALDGSGKEIRAPAAGEFKRPDKIVFSRTACFIGDFEVVARS
jgi:hypothetical protein